MLILTTTTISSTELAVDDLNITITSGAADAASANGAGITVDSDNTTSKEEQQEHFVNSQDFK